MENIAHSEYISRRIAEDIDTSDIASGMDGWLGAWLDAPAGLAGCLRPVVDCARLRRGL